MDVKAQTNLLSEYEYHKSIESGCSDPETKNWHFNKRTEIEALARQSGYETLLAAMVKNKYIATSRDTLLHDNVDD
jgi:hypothetical protein